MALSFICCVYYAIFISSFSSAYENDAVIRVPIVHMESGLQRLLNQGADLTLVEGLYNMSLRMAQPMLTDQEGKPIPTNDTLNLFKYFQTEFYGVINIGKPGKQFKMVIDTAWAYTWVVSYDCPRTSIQCATHERYDHRQSSTYKKDGRSFNISNRYVGYLSNDIFHAGHLNASNQIFAELTRLPFIYAIYETDGLLGLGLRELSPGYNPFFYNFVEENNLKKMFSIYINRDPTTPRGGSLLFGAIDYKHNRSAFTTVDVVGNNYWQFNMKKLSVIVNKKQRSDFCANGCMAMADTSSNTIIGPKEEVDKINQMIGAEKLFFTGRYMIPCVNQYKGLKVSFTIGDREFIIKAQDYIQILSYSGVQICLSAFQPDDEKKYPPNTWSLGGAFLYRYYTVFDVENRKIMIADVS